MLLAGSIRLQEWLVSLECCDSFWEDSWLFILVAGQHWSTLMVRTECHEQEGLLSVLKED